MRQNAQADESSEKEKRDQELRQKERQLMLTSIHNKMESMTLQQLRNLYEIVCK